MAESLPESPELRRSPEEWLAEVQRFQRDGELFEAYVLAQQGLGQHPDDWALRENFGLLLSLAQDLPSANEQLRAAMRLAPQAPGPYFSLAGVLALQGQNDEAVKYYRESLRLEPDNFHAWIRLGIVELNRRRFQEAIQHLRAAIRAKPDSVAARMYLGGVLMQEQRRTEAQELFREVLRLEPNNAEARRLLHAAGAPD